MFTPPDDCSACRATKVSFRKLGIDYQIVEADDATVEKLREEGHTAFPVVKVDLGDEASWSWSGYRFDDIKRLAQILG